MKHSASCKVLKSVVIIDCVYSALIYFQFIFPHERFLCMAMLVVVVNFCKLLRHKSVLSVALTFLMQQVWYPRANKSCKFLSMLDSIKKQQSQQEKIIKTHSNFH